MTNSNYTNTQAEGEKPGDHGWVLRAFEAARAKIAADPEHYVRLAENLGMHEAAARCRALSSPPAGQLDMRKVVEALGFDPENHHNAAKCPYCTPAGQGEPVAWRCRQLHWEKAGAITGWKYAETRPALADYYRWEIRPLYALPQPDTGGEVTYTEFQLLTDPESHPILKAMLDLRLRAASSFTPEFSGQRFEDYDRALLACLEAARAVLISGLSQTSGTGT